MELTPPPLRCNFFYCPLTEFLLLSILCVGYFIQFVSSLCLFDESDGREDNFISNPNYPVTPRLGYQRFFLNTILTIYVLLNPYS